MPSELITTASTGLDVSVDRTVSRIAAATSSALATTGGTNRTIEAFLLDYPGTSLYGHALYLSLQKRLRDEQKFESLDVLKNQIARDVAQVASL